MHFIGGSLKSLESRFGEQSVEAEILILIKQGEEIKAFDKYLLSPPADSTIKDFQDLKLFELSSGEYSLEILAVDSHDENNTFEYKAKVSIPLKKEQVALSNIQLLANIQEGEKEGFFNKNGFSFEILPFDFYDKKYNQLHFYAESYVHKPTEESLYLEVGLYQDFYLDKQAQLISNSIKPIEENKSILPLLKSLDLSKIPSGNFHLRLSIINKQKEILSISHKNFQRSNPFIDLEVMQKKDEFFEHSFVNKLDDEKLNYYLKAHIPIAQYAMNNVLNTIIDNNDNKSKRYFIYKYWKDQSIDHAEALFYKYIEIAEAIDKMYNSGFGFGFETDRGFMYLKYGRPTQSINVSDEVSAPPYEIWVYDRIPETGQSNVKFIFYNPSLTTNDYQLLHSTCIGERRNLQWETVLYGNAITEDSAGPGGIDNTRAPDNFGRNARKLFNDL